jgi:hypothetical protein
LAKQMYEELSAENNEEAHNVLGWLSKDGVFTI